MKTRPFRSAAAIVWLLFAAARPVLSQNISPPGEKPVTLPSFGASLEKTDRYRATTATSVARIDDRILDTPMSVNVVSGELMDDLGAGSLYDAARYFGGISAGRGAGAGGIMDRLDFRGYESFSRNIDDFSGLLQPTGVGPQANFDPVFVERAELVMGPDMMLSPAASSGGSINLITKSPRFTSANDITGQVGNDNAQKITIDSTGPVNQHLAYRVIGSYQDTRTFVPGKVRQTNGSVQLAYKFSDTSKLTLKWFGEDWKLTGAAANPAYNGEMVYTPDTILGATLSNQPQPGLRYDGWNGSARWSQRTDRLNIAELEYTGVIADLVSMRLAAQAVNDNFTQDVGYPLGPSDTVGFGGQVIINPINPASVPEEALWSHQVNYNEQIENDYAASFHPGNILLQPMLGWSYQQGSNPTNANLEDTSPADMPAANLLASDYYAPPHPPLSRYNASFQSAHSTPGHVWLYQAYALTKAELYDGKVTLIGGATRTWAHPIIYDFDLSGKLTQVQTFSSPQVFTSGFFGLPPFLHPAQKSHRDDYFAGAVLKPAKNISLYYSFSTSAGIEGNASISEINVFWHGATQHEFGAKVEFFDHRLLFTASHFQISESGAPVTMLAGSGILRQVTLQSNEANHGFEFNLTGGLTENLSAVANFTEMKLRDDLGRRQRNIPDQMANLLLNYHVTGGMLNNFDVFLGLEHTGNVAGEDILHTVYLAPPSPTPPEQPGFYLAPWTVLNAGAGYTWRRYRFNLNVDNVLNSKFWWQASGRQSVVPYPGITVRFTTRVHF